ncbi:hypothetical protein IFR05_005047 [Cadophora sp. M221]|nr:hypothetical protein IFR05_005047 [Cadophora sp. M221]
MSSFSRITAALASATNELTVAAANFSFDFSLMTVEAPTEFHPLGETLSEQRRDEAENGIAHVTAQKLGALFKEIPPHTPELVKAYDNRVSEIPQLAAAKVHPPSASAIFASHAGADGTSIWAAATSGHEALPIQLLSCMLARLWNGPEATSVWVELVKERQLEIAKKCEKGESLSEWDASARAWLRTADEVKKLKQTQLMLIIDNLDIPVNHDMRVYSSVMAAWKTALDSLERMVVGMPQSLHQDGAIFLGLAAWHLYPDLLVLSGLEEAKSIRIQDSLIAPGGILTIGLQLERKPDSKGIYWSLSLAHLRYYGDPVLRQRKFARDSSRIHLEQLMQVAIASLSTYWKTAGCDSLSTAAILMAVGELIDRVHETTKEGNLSPEQISCKRFGQLGPNWLQTLITGAKSITDATGAERDVLLRLLNVGEKHGKDFLIPMRKGSPTFLDPVFGLCDLKRLLSLLRGCEPRIRILRQLAARCGMHHADVVIRYEIYDETGQPIDWMLGVEQDQNDNDAESREDLLMPTIEPSSMTFHPPTMGRGLSHRGSHFEYTLATPQIRLSAKRTSDGEVCDKAVYQRWLQKEDFWMHNTAPEDTTKSCNCIGKCQDESCACVRRNALCTSACRASTVKNDHDECENTEAATLYSSRMRDLQAAGEECFIQNENGIKIHTDGLDRFAVRTKDRWVNYLLFAGDPKIAAIFIRENSVTSNKVT